MIRACCAPDDINRFGSRVHGRCIEKVPWDEKQYEDTYFGISCAAVKLRLPSKEQLFIIKLNDSDHNHA
jgi:hypothetical protein